MMPMIVFVVLISAREVRNRERIVKDLWPYAPINALHPQLSTLSGSQRRYPALYSGNLPSVFFSPDRHGTAEPGLDDRGVMLSARMPLFGVAPTRHCEPEGQHDGSEEGNGLGTYNKSLFDRSLENKNLLHKNPINRGSGVFQM